MSYHWLPLPLVEFLEKIAAAYGVSKVARSQRGFLTAYKKAKGDPSKLSDYWIRRRQGFITRHVAQVKERKESLWKNGRPTRRHLALTMWAYSPQPGRLGRYVNALLEDLVS